MPYDGFNVSLITNSLIVTWAIIPHLLVLQLRIHNFRNDIWLFAVSGVSIINMDYELSDDIHGNIC